MLVARDDEAAVVTGVPALLLRRSGLCSNGCREVLGPGTDGEEGEMGRGGRRGGGERGERRWEGGEGEEGERREEGREGRGEEGEEERAYIQHVHVALST